MSQNFRLFRLPNLSVELSFLVARVNGVFEYGQRRVDRIDFVGT